MAIKVNNTATSKDGLEIPAGYIIGFNFEILDGIKNLYYYPKVFINEQARVDKKAVVLPEFLDKLTYEFTPTDEQFASLNPLSVNQFYQTYLETLTEIGTNTEIIL